MFEIKILMPVVTLEAEAGEPVELRRSRLSWITSETPSKNALKILVLLFVSNPHLNSFRYQMLKIGT